MKKDLLILDFDKKAAQKRIDEIEAEIIALGPDFYDAFNQTSETYHDNVQFEIVRDKQNLLAVERYKLKQILFNSLPSIPKQPKNKVGIGSNVTILNIDSHKTTSYFIAGDWASNVGETVNNSIVVSRESPIAKCLLNKKIGDSILFNGKWTIIKLTTI